MRGISIKAVFFGAVADIAASTIFGVPLGIYVVSSHGLTNLHKDALRSAVVAIVHDSLLLYAAQLLIGFGASILGGFVAASLARENKRLNGTGRYVTCCSCFDDRADSVVLFVGRHIASKARCVSQLAGLTIGWSYRGSHLRWAKEGVDDWDKSASFAGNATPRRSSSSLDPFL